MLYSIRSLCVIPVLCLSIQTLTAKTPLDWMRDHVGLREEPLGSNRGPIIDSANTYCRVPLGSYWCASIISYSYYQTGHKSPRTAWSPALFPTGKLIYINPQPGDLGGIYFPDLGRIGHVTMISRKYGSFYELYEGNTGDGGSRNGDGLYRRIRPVMQIRKVSRWTLE